MEDVAFSWSLLSDVSLLGLRKKRSNPNRLAFFSHFSGLFWGEIAFSPFLQGFTDFHPFRVLDCDFILCPLLTLNFVLFTSSEQSDRLNRVTFSLIFEKIE